MKPVVFPEHNCVYAKDQPEYLPLPVLKIPAAEGECISCWKLSWRERFTAFFQGRVWLSQLTFNLPLQPVRLAVKQDEMFIVKAQQGGKETDK
jgi:hypothetical protein